MIFISQTFEHKLEDKKVNSEKCFLSFNKIFSSIKISICCSGKTIKIENSKFLMNVMIEDQGKNLSVKMKVIVGFLRYLCWVPIVWHSSVPWLNKLLHEFLENYLHFLILYWNWCKKFSELLHLDQINGIKIGFVFLTQSGYFNLQHSSGIWRILSWNKVFNWFWRWLSLFTLR